MAVAPRVGGVEQHEVEVTSEAAMLEAIVEKEHFALEFFHGGDREGGAVGPLQVGHVGQVLFEHQGLVVEAPLAAVTTAEDGDAAVALPEPGGDILDAGRLAGAAGGEVADADNGNGGALCPGPAAV